MKLPQSLRADGMTRGRETRGVFPAPCSRRRGRQSNVDDEEDAKQGEGFPVWSEEASETDPRVEEGKSGVSYSSKH